MGVLWYKQIILLISKLSLLHLSSHFNTLPLLKDFCIQFTKYCWILLSDMFFKSYPAQFLLSHPHLLHRSWGWLWLFWFGNPPNGQIHHENRVAVQEKKRLINITFFRVIALQGLQTQFDITRTSVHHWVNQILRCTTPEPWGAEWFLCWSGQDTSAIIHEPPFWSGWEKSSGENKTLEVLPEAGPVCWTRVKREEVGPQLQISD